MSYTNRVMNGILLVFCFNVLTNLIGYALRLYLGRTFTMQEFGLVYSILSTVGIVSLFIYLGLNEAVVKFISDFRARGDVRSVNRIGSSVLAFQLVFSVLLCVAVFLAAEPLAEHYFRSMLAIWPIRIYALAICISPFMVLFSSFLQAYQRPLSYASLAFVQSALLLLGTVCMLAFAPWLGVSGAILPYLLAYCILIPVYFILCRRLVPGMSIAPRHVDMRMLKRVFAYSIPITLTVLSYTLLTYTDTLMITYYRSLEEVGLYNAALPTANILLFFATSVATVFLPIVAELWTKRKKALLQDALAQAYVLLGAAIVPGAMLFVAFPDIIINLLFGAEFLQGASALRALSLTSILTTFSLFNGAVLAGIGSPKKMARAVAFGAVVNVVMNALLIPRIGFLGAAIATLISSVIIFVASTYAVREGIESRFPFVKWWLTLLSGGVLLALVAWMRQAIALPLWWKLAVILPVGGIVYAACLWAFRVITPGEVRMLAARLFRRE